MVNDEHIVISNGDHLTDGEYESVTLAVVDQASSARCPCRFRNLAPVVTSLPRTAVARWGSGDVTFSEVMCACAATPLGIWVSPV